MFTVYVLYSVAVNKHYTGFTIDITSRMISHNELGHGWTAKYRPWVIIYTKAFETKEAAITYELWLKTGVGREFIKTLPHPSAG